MEADYMWTPVTCRNVVMWVVCRSSTFVSLRMLSFVRQDQMTDDQD